MRLTQPNETSVAGPGLTVLTDVLILLTSHTVRSRILVVSIRHQTCAILNARVTHEQMNIKNNSLHMFAL